MKENKIEFYNNKNQKLAGLLAIPETKNCPIIIIIHGFKGSKEHYIFVNNAVPEFVKSGYAVLRIDCRGSGESDGEFKDITVESESDDVITTLEYAKTLENVDKNRIALIGISLGASAIVTAHNSIKEKIKTLVFWGGMFFGTDYYNTPENIKSFKEKGTFSSYQRLTGKTFETGKKLFDELKSMDLSEKLSKIKTPTIFIVGQKDKEHINYAEKANKLVKNSEIKIIENGDHNFSDKSAENKLIQETVEWLKEHM